MTKITFICFSKYGFALSVINCVNTEMISGSQFLLIPSAMDLFNKCMSRDMSFKNASLWPVSHLWNIRSFFLFDFQVLYKFSMLNIKVHALNTH